MPTKHPQRVRYLQVGLYSVGIYLGASIPGGIPGCTRVLPEYDQNSHSWNSSTLDYIYMPSAKHTPLKNFRGGSAPMLIASQAGRSARYSHPRSVGRSACDQRSILTRIMEFLLPQRVRRETLTEGVASEAGVRGNSTKSKAVTDSVTAPSVSTWHGRNRAVGRLCRLYLRWGQGLVAVGGVTRWRRLVKLTPRRGRTERKTPQERMRSLLSSSARLKTTTYDCCGGAPAASNGSRSKNVTFSQGNFPCGTHPYDVLESRQEVRAILALDFFFCIPQI